ncbi:hypothetical protein K490DRAFT_53136 [Saccharata proteae CBS 121410]|uniref:Uncharacterized protein n=1 Tax=Saccharata proteae CBS 121410 TaxID=1314787 RepID=A0A9P4M3L4_9PEZI|nr:hypothetical protein K490DRAFT_53136 [Saccharata proteae CBS 121410]
MNGLAHELHLRNRSARGANNTTDQAISDQQSIPPSPSRRARVAAAIQEKLRLTARKPTVTLESHAPGHKQSPLRRLFSRSSLNTSYSQLAQPEDKVHEPQQYIAPCEEKTDSTTTSSKILTIAPTSESESVKLQASSLCDDVPHQRPVADIESHHQRQSRLLEQSSVSDVDPTRTPSSHATETPAPSKKRRCRQDLANSSIDKNDISDIWQDLAVEVIDDGKTVRQLSKHLKEHEGNFAAEQTLFEKEKETLEAEKRAIEDDRKTVRQLFAHLKQHEQNLAAERSIIEKEKELFKAEKRAFEKEKFDAERAMVAATLEASSNALRCAVEIDKRFAKTNREEQPTAHLRSTAKKEGDDILDRSREALRHGAELDKRYGKADHEEPIIEHRSIAMRRIAERREQAAKKAREAPQPERKVRSKGEPKVKVFNEENGTSSERSLRERCHTGIGEYSTSRSMGLRRIAERRAREVQATREQTQREQKVRSKAEPVFQIFEDEEPIVQYRSMGLRRIAERREEAVKQAREEPQHERMVRPKSATGRRVLAEVSGNCTKGFEPMSDHESKWRNSTPSMPSNPAANRRFNRLYGSPGSEDPERPRMVRFAEKNERKIFFRNSIIRWRRPELSEPIEDMEKRQNFAEKIEGIEKEEQNGKMAYHQPSVCDEDEEEEDQLLR